MGDTISTRKFCTFTVTLDLQGGSSDLHSWITLMESANYFDPQKKLKKSLSTATTDATTKGTHEPFTNKIKFKASMASYNVFDHRCKKKKKY